MDVDNRLREVEIQLGRVEQRVEDHEGDIHRFAGLPMELAEIRFAQGQMNKSLDGAHDAIRELSGRLDREHAERVEGQAERKQELEAAREERNLEIQRIKADQERALLEQQKLNADLKSRQFQTLIGLLGIFLTAAASVVVPLLSSGGHP